MQKCDNLTIVMEEEEAPKPDAEDSPTVYRLSPAREDLCSRLDAFHDAYKLKAKPSEMFRGAIFTSQETIAINSDWLAQAANSLREIIYSLPKDPTGGRRDGAFIEYGSVGLSQEVSDELDRVYGLLNDLAHHGSKQQHLAKDFSDFTQEDFDKLVEDFEKVMVLALARGVDIHNEIDEVLGSAQ
jgi:hypothetical protein